MKITVLVKGQNSQILSGNPVVTSLDGTRKATLQTILHESWTSAEREEFGIYSVVVSPPENHYWTGEIEGLIPVYRATEKSEDEIVADFIKHIEGYYDSVAQSLRYDNRLTCALRAGYPGPFQAEGIAFATWMDECNSYGYQVIEDVKAGLRPMPTTEELISELPKSPWAPKDEVVEPDPKADPIPE